MSKPDKKSKQDHARDPQDAAASGNARDDTPTPQAHRESVLTDVQTLRERARKSIDDGAVTQSYSADRKTVIRLLNEALATEWVCVLRYYRHYFMASGMLADSVKAEFLEHAQQELAHAHQIVGQPEADAKQGRISYDSPLGRALIGHSEGDAVKVDAPRGRWTARILSVRRQ